jgi:hypothetical protein
MHRAIAIGYRFKLVREVDRFPDFVAKTGSTGTVCLLENDVWGQMDQAIPGAREWDNQIHWDTVEDFLSDSEPLK